MNILIGLAFWLVLFAIAGVSFYGGYRVGKQQVITQPVVDEDAKRKAKETTEHFQNLFNYDVPTALQRKKVTHE